MKLVDFDWGGHQDGQGVVYREYLNVELPWSARVSAGTAIKQEHDLELLSRCAAGPLDKAEHACLAADLLS